METRVLKSRFSGIKGAKKEPRLLEKSSTSYLGPGDRGFKSRSPDQRAKTVYQFCPLTQRISSMDRASLLRREGCGFESRMRVFRCLVQRFALTQWCQGFVFTKVSRQFSARKLAVLTLLKGFSLFIAAQFLNPHDRSRYPWNR